MTYYDTFASRFAAICRIVSHPIIFKCEKTSGVNIGTGFKGYWRMTKTNKNYDLPISPPNFLQAVLNFVVKFGLILSFQNYLIAFMYKYITYRAFWQKYISDFCTKNTKWRL